MLASEVDSADYSDGRLDSMDSVFDSIDIKAGVRAFFENVITPFAEQKDWAMLAEWNANSIIGCFQRHLDQCIASSDKTRDLMKNAMREDVGTEISMLNVDKLIFRRDAQDLNIKRAEMIVNELLLTYEVAFGKKFMPRAKSSGKDVTKQAQMKEYNLARLKEAMKK